MALFADGFYREVPERPLDVGPGEPRGAMSQADHGNFFAADQFVHAASAWQIQALAKIFLRQQAVR